MKFLEKKTLLHKLYGKKERHLTQERGLVRGMNMF